MSLEEKFREYLLAQGKRLTTERATVVREVSDCSQPFGADQLVAWLNPPMDGHRVSRATVYRTLTQLVDSGLLRVVDRRDDRDLYERDEGQFDE